MDNLMGSLTILSNKAILMYIFKGVAFTLVISVISVVFGLVIASVLALVRNYCHKAVLQRKSSMHKTLHFKVMRWLTWVTTQLP